MNKDDKGCSCSVYVINMTIRFWAIVVIITMIIYLLMDK